MANGVDFVNRPREGIRFAEVLQQPHYLIGHRQSIVLRSRSTTETDVTMFTSGGSPLSHTSIFPTASKFLKIMTCDQSGKATTSPEPRRKEVCKSLTSSSKTSPGSFPPANRTVAASNLNVAARPSSERKDRSSATTLSGYLVYARSIARLRSLHVRSCLLKVAPRSP